MPAPWFSRSKNPGGHSGAIFCSSSLIFPLERQGKRDGGKLILSSNLPQPYLSKSWYFLPPVKSRSLTAGRPALATLSARHGPRPPGPIP